MSSAAAHAQPAARPVELGADLYREIFAPSREAIAITDPKGVYLQQHGAHITLLGYSDDDLEGKPPALDLDEDTYAVIPQELPAAVEYADAVAYRSRRGEELSVELTVCT